MGKKVEGWQKGVGPYSKTDDIKMTQVPQTPFAKGSKDCKCALNILGEKDNG